MQNKPIDNLDQSIPCDFSISVLMQRAPSDNPWLDHRWQTLGVTAALSKEVAPDRAVTLVHEQGEVRHYLHSGFRLRLYVDECESYYHNLCSPVPSCFVIMGEEEEGVVEPLLVSLSFDEANAYLEGDEQVDAVAMPPELYRWCELFVLQHYVPQQKKKRRLEDWSRGMKTGARS